MIRLNLCIQMVLVFAVVLSMSAVHAVINTTDVNLNEIKDNLFSHLPEGVTLPNDLKDLDANEVINQASTVFKEKCIKNSGSDAAYEEASQATTKVMECIQDIIDFNTIQQEIDEAKPNGNLDTVFSKYCNRRAEAVKCVEDFTGSLDACLDEAEKKQKTVFINITKSLLEFTCHENGNQIALFIAEEGPECFENTRDQLQDCFNKTMGKYVGNETPTLENLPTLVINEENCKDMDNLELCVVKELEKCKESTPANLVEALFRFVRKETPCGKIKKETKPNSSDATKLSMNVLIGTWLMALFAKFLVSY